MGTHDFVFGEPIQKTPTKKSKKKNKSPQPDTPPAQNTPHNDFVNDHENATLETSAAKKQKKKSKKKERDSEVDALVQEILVDEDFVNDHENATLETSAPKKQKKKSKKKERDSEVDTLVQEKIDDDHENGGHDVVFEESSEKKRKKKSKKKRKEPKPDASLTENIAHDTGDGEDAGGTQIDDNEPTMGDKLASLDLGKSDDMETQERKDPLVAQPPSADSVHVLLKQALHADDRALLLDCLYNQDDKVIANSVSWLSPADIFKLLDSLISII